MKAAHVIILLIASLSLIEARRDRASNKAKTNQGPPAQKKEPKPPPPDPVFALINKFPTEYSHVCSTIKTGGKILWDRKVLCQFELFEERYETPKCLLCPEVCNDEKVAAAEHVPDKKPTFRNKMKISKDRTTVARKELCKAISATNGEAACQKRLISDEKKNNVVYVYTLCKTACTPYFKGKKKEIDEKDCGYNKSKKKGGPPEPPPPPPGPDPIVKLIINFPKEYESICDFILKELLFDKKQPKRNLKELETGTTYNWY